MPILRNCKICGTQITAYSTLQTKCRDCTLKNAKPIPQQGKHARIWRTFRDAVAIPYLDKRYGITCTDCGVLPPRKDDGTYYRHDVDHVKERSTHPHLRYDVKNLAYRCRLCHIKKTMKK